MRHGHGDAPVAAAGPGRRRLGRTRHRAAAAGRAADGRPGAWRGPVPGTDADRQEGRGGRRSGSWSSTGPAAPACAARPMRWCAKSSTTAAARPDMTLARYACDPRAVARPAPSRGAGAHPHRIPARPGPHRALHRVSSAGLQDAGVPEPRGRSVSHAADAFARGGAAGPLDRAVAAAQRGPGGGNRPGARPGTHAVRPCRPGCAERLHGGLGRLRTQPAEPAGGGRTGRTLSAVQRTESHLRNARGHPQALFARQRPADRGGSNPAVWRGGSSTAASPAWRRSCAIWPTRSPTTRTTSTTACGPG